MPLSYLLLRVLIFWMRACLSASKEDIFYCSCTSRSYPLSFLADFSIEAERCLFGRPLDFGAEDSTGFPPMKPSTLMLFSFNFWSIWSYTWSRMLWLSPSWFWLIEGYSSYFSGRADWVLRSYELSLIWLMVMHSWTYYSSLSNFSGGNEKRSNSNFFWTACPSFSRDWTIGTIPFFCSIVRYLVMFSNIFCFFRFSSSNRPSESSPSLSESSFFFFLSFFFLSFLSFFSFFFFSCLSEISPNSPCLSLLLDRDPLRLALKG